MRDALTTVGIFIAFLAVLAVAATLSLWLGEWAWMATAGVVVLIGLVITRR